MVCSCVYKNSQYWGPVLWSLLHHIPRKIQYVSNIARAIEFIQNFFIALPCAECHQHAKAYIMSHPIVLSNPLNLIISKYELSLYLFHFHNTVNLRLNKPILHNHDIYYLQPIAPVNIMALTSIFNNEDNKKFFESHLTFHQKIWLKNIISFYSFL